MAWLSSLLLSMSLMRLGAAGLSGQQQPGPILSTAAKRAIKVCNILDHGGVASRTADNGPAIAAAWNECRAGGEVHIPAGEYGLGTWVDLAQGTQVSLNIDGTIFRIGRGGGNMFLIRDSDDVEVYSATGLGAIQGFGYEFHKAPAFHLTLDNSTNGEVYNLVIHGGYQGGLDGVDVWGSNIWVHDVEVSNKDECVTVKSPAKDILVESVHCNWSGGCAMGSLSTDTSISNVVYQNIYTHHSNQLYMFKSRGGSGSVSSVQLNNFIGHTNAYGFDLDTNWLRQTVGAGPGVSYSKISVTNWKGTSRNDQIKRAAINVVCPAAVPCTKMLIRDVDIRNENGSPIVQNCKNAFGSGACLEGRRGADMPGSELGSASDSASAVAPFVPAMLDNELPKPFDVSEPIPIPAMPALFFPGIPPKHPILAHTQTSDASRNSMPL
ncbi:hypothetical protein E4U21_003080 [Claviceps maximensis]|nr:hypothetical protein E4U21_003080 [Claviceps maximensis]